MPQNIDRIGKTVVAAVAIAGLSGCMTRGPRIVEPPPTDRPLPPNRPVRVVPVQPATSIAPSAVLDAPEPVDLTVAPIVTRPEGQSYTVKEGDLLSRIAYDWGLNWRDLAEYNNLSNPNHLEVGTTLVIPPYAKKRSSGGKTATAAPKPASAAVKTLTGGKYVVQKNDSLWVIARKAGTTVSALKAANNLSSDRLLVGQTLVLPGAGSKPAAADAPAPKPAKAVEKPVEAVEPVQPVVAKPTPQPLSLEVPSPSIEVAPAAEKADVPAAEEEPAPVKDDNVFDVVVEEGETLEDIARAYLIPIEVVRELNGLSENAVLKPGDTLKMPAGTY